MISNKLNSHFSYEYRNKIVFVEDRFDEYISDRLPVFIRTVTNDVENVVEFLLKQYPGLERILYKDTNANWDEIKFAKINGEIHITFHILDKKDEDIEILKHEK